MTKLRLTGFLTPRRAITATAVIRRHIAPYAPRIGVSAQDAGVTNAMSALGQKRTLKHLHT
jgi:hypothetical protein